MPEQSGRAPFPDRGARVLTTVFAFSTVVALVTWVLGHWGNRQPNWLELLVTLFNVPLSHSIASVALLGLITRALLGRKRIGLVAVAVCQLFGMYLGIAVLVSWPTSPLLRGWRSEHALYLWLDVASLPLGALVLVALWRMRSAFTGRVRKGSWWRATLVAILGICTTFLATVGLLILSRPAGSPLGWDRILAVLFRGLGETGRDYREDMVSVPVWVPTVTSALITVTMLASVMVFLRYAEDLTRWSGRRELEIRRLIRRYGASDSLAYFATRRDKASVFSPDGEAVISYRVSFGVSLASGDPIGKPESWPAAISAWKEDATRFGWIPAVLAASTDGARRYAQQGLHVMSLGDEAILDAHTFTLANKKLAQVRAAVQHARRAGLTVDIAYQGQIPPQELAALLHDADRWRHGETERGFSMALNRSGDPADAHVLYVKARNELGELVGLLTFVPWGPGGVSLDVMRRSPEAPHGVTELMVSHLMGSASKLGIRWVSLNFCMFRRVYSEAAEFGASTVTRLNSSFLGLLDRFWQLDRLYRANRQYDPRWEPRFICYDDRVGLPQILVAVGSAEGFLPRYRLTHPSGEQRLTPAELVEVRELEAQPAIEPTQREVRQPEAFRIRQSHLDALADRPDPPYTPGSRSMLTVAQLLSAPSSGSDTVSVSGRITSIRDHGGVVFAALTGGGATVQLLLERDHLDQSSYDAFRHLVDHGDIVAVVGALGVSRKGTTSLLVERWTVLAKALHAIPFGQFTNPEARVRRRSTDLIANPRQADLLRQRSSVVTSLRKTLDELGYTEVETPILQRVHGGASARPFKTHINAYDLDLSLRIAPELYLKRLVVGGLGPVYEIGRNFRNEGADATHNPEFTALEAYQPGADYHTMRALTQTLIVAAATAVHGRAVLPDPSAGPDGRGSRAASWVPLLGTWPVIPVLEAVSRAVGVPVSLDTETEVLVDLAHDNGITVQDRSGSGVVIEALYAGLVEPATVAPTFYVDFPKDTSPLAAAHRTKPGLVERWDLVMRGMEIATGYSELTDPLDQRRRLTAQSLKAAAGDPEAMELDEDFLYALETGMSPTGGLGLGVDRLVMLLTNTTIRSVLTFPFVKPTAD
ncbi:MAG TPA: bifunctional lysylphosphatidylglycerol synthetase/lysine--tRNA ligase LysX [Propionicimonas sp.]